MRTTRNKIRGVLEIPEFQSLVRYYDEGVTVVRYLISCLYDADVLIKWRAIHGLGHLSGHIGKTDGERVRRIIRDLLWSMNDESGSIIWNAPEAMGEILVNNPRLIDEYCELLIANLYLEPFPKGVIWAMGRIGGVNADCLNRYIPDLILALEKPDAVIRAYAVQALGNILRNTGIPPELEPLLDDPSIVPIYDYESCNLVRMALQDITQQTIQKIVKG